jgi:hypothetical protein
MIKYHNVHSQAELETALAADDVIPMCIGDGHYHIPAASGSATVQAHGSATVQAHGSATVRAYDSATVRAYGSATVRAYDSATVRAYGSATVRAYGSATVQAHDSATVQAYGSATVRASGSATVRASGSATVRASGSATVRAYGSATVRAYGSATVRAYGSATVQATKYVAVHQFAPTATITGGVVIGIPDWGAATIEDWADYTDCTITGRTITVYKAVDQQLTSDHGTAYPIGETVTAPDWAATRACSNGLHFSQTPQHARCYQQGATRFLACQIRTDDAVVLGHDKIKARSCVVLHEVDIDGQPLTDAAGGAA